MKKKIFTWYRLEEGIRDKIRMLAKEGSLSGISQNESWIDHTAGAYSYRQNCEVANIGE